MKTGIELITIERQEQIKKHGRTPCYDMEQNNDGQLIEAAHMLLNPDTGILRNHPPLDWNKDIWRKMCDKPHSERIIISGALIAADIDRRHYKDSYEAQLALGSGDL